MLQLSLIELLLFILSSSQVIAYAGLFQNGQEISHFPTFDFFQYQPHFHFEVQGIPHEMILNGTLDQSCRLSLPPADQVKNLSSIITWISLKESQNRCFLDNISATFAFAKQLDEWLQSNGHSKSLGLVVVREMEVLGAPYFDYISYARGYDGPPPENLNFALLDVPKAKYQELLSNLRTKTDLLKLSQEPGEWNKSYLSNRVKLPSFLAFTMSSIALFTFVFGFIRAYNLNNLKFDLRTFILIGSFIALFLYLMVFWMPIYTFRRYLVELIINFICGVLFHLLLFLWTIVLRSSGQLDKLVTISRTFVSTSLLIMATASALNLLNIFMNFGGRLEHFMKNVLFFMTTFCQLIIAVLFIFFAIYFLLKSYSVKGFSDDTYRLLLKLSFLGIFASFIYMALASLHVFIFFFNSFALDVTLTTHLTKLFLSPSRPIALMFVLGITHQIGK